ncbi:MAG: hypothetical protein LUD00_07485 [Prevotellaceae bacterium]|nr:hypothetical protein [Prevotellaceae bacterium]
MGCLRQTPPSLNIHEESVNTSTKVAVLGISAICPLHSLFKVRYIGSVTDETWRKQPKRPSNLLKEGL